MKIEEIKTASIEEVESRMKEIRTMNLDEVEDLKELDKEVDALKERKKELKNDAKEKQELRKKILDGKIEQREIQKPKEKREMELTKENFRSSKEYRIAYLSKLQGRELTAEQRSAIALAGADPVVPEQMQTSILSKVKEYAPVLGDITLLHVNGAVKFAVEGTTNEASIHTENATITADSDTLVSVDLSTYEVTKLVQISASVKSMTIDAFESWLVDNIAEAIAMKLENLVFNGTGTGEAKGVNNIAFEATAKVTVGASASLTSANVFSLFGMLKSGYARNAKIYMRRTTLFNDFLPLMDNSKNHLVVREGNDYYVLGIKVSLTDSIKDHEAILGDMKKYVGNLAEDMNVKNAFDINTNSYKYLGVANFDGKPAIEEAFVKLVKATS